jgi:hypothetical protein
VRKRHGPAHKMKLNRQMKGWNQETELGGVVNH